MTRVKICGITSAHDAKAVIEAGADFIGVVLSHSPRRAGIEQLPGIIEAAGSCCPVVGVFANAVDLLAFDAECQIPLDYYQVYFENAGLPVRPPRTQWISSFQLTSFDQVPRANSDSLRLYDFKSGAISAARARPSAERSTIRERSIVAGNLTVSTVTEVVTRLQPFGVDVARGTESSPGIKDLKLVEQFIRKVRDAS
jgi:phosphoribosylanthranilate isomerase